MAADGGMPAAGRNEQVMRALPRRNGARFTPTRILSTR